MSPSIWLIVVHRILCCPRKSQTEVHLVFTLFDVLPTKYQLKCAFISVQIIWCALDSDVEGVPFDFTVHVTSPPFEALSDWYPDTLIQTVWWSHDVVISICGDLYVTVFRYLKSIYSPARVRGFTFVYLDHIYSRRSMWFQQLERCKPTNSIWTVSIFRQSCNGLMALKNFLFSSVPNILCELGSSVKVKA